MKSMNQLISEYTSQIQQGDLPHAYRGILEFIGKLRADFANKFPQYEVRNVYQGRMDITFFAISSQELLSKELKIAVVYLHEKGHFEVWLSARNRSIARQYRSINWEEGFGQIKVFHDENNPDAIIECTLTSNPNFDDQDQLISLMVQGVEDFMQTIIHLLN